MLSDDPQDQKRRLVLRHVKSVLSYDMRLDISHALHGKVSELKSYVEAADEEELLTQQESVFSRYVPSSGSSDSEKYGGVYAIGDNPRRKWDQNQQRN